LLEFNVDETPLMQLIKMTVWSAFYMPSNFSAHVALLDCLLHQTVLGWLTACLRCLFF